MTTRLEQWIRKDIRSAERKRCTWRVGKEAGFRHAIEVLEELRTEGRKLEQSDNADFLTGLDAAIETLRDYADKEPNETY